MDNTNSVQAKTRQELIGDIEKRVADKILEQSNADLLIKLINNADSLDEAMSISALGTTYKRTGFHFDKKLEKTGDHINYFKKNNELSFHTDDAKPTHKLIIGDNYQALQNLLIQYRSKINVIYIDPPYGKDSMGEFAKTNYNNAITRDNLLSMLYPRLQLAKQLLADDGVIFCSIDDKNQAYVKCLFDEIFGEDVFLGNFIWQKKTQPSFLSPEIAVITEHILTYKKNKNVLRLKGGFIDTEKDGELINIGNPIGDRILPADFLEIERGNFTGILKKGLYGNGDLKIELKNDVNVVNGIPTNDLHISGRFIRSQSTIDNDVQNGAKLFIRSIKTMRPTINLNRTDAIKPPTSLLSKKLNANIPTNTDASSEMKNIFSGLNLASFPKPIGLITFLIDAILYNSPDALILDFFAGSGTTGHAVLDLNRSEYKAKTLIDEEQPEGNRTFILVQLDEDLDEALKNKQNNLDIIKNQINLCDKINRPHKLSEITTERLRRIMLGESLDKSKDFKWIEKNKPYGGNLDVYEIAEVSNFEWTEGKTPFDVIDETLYGQAKFNTIKEKIEWVCGNFDKTQKYLENQPTEE